MAYTLHIQEYLRHYSLAELEENLHIFVRRHPKYNNLVHFKYNQIESPMGDPVVQECRSLILDESQNWQVVSFPYKKFFNYGEGHAAEIDWRNASVQEKLDGSLMILYYYDNQWHVSTSGTPDADTLMPVGSETFKDCFWRVWKQLGYELPLLNNTCYMFELLTPHNRVVVPQKCERLILHGARNVYTLRESEPSYVAAREGWQCVRAFPLTSWEEVIRVCNELNPMEQEGFVICDSSFNRVKAKSPQYVALHHIQGSFSARRMLEIIRTNENEEFLSYFPEWRSTHEEIKRRVDSFLQEAEDLWLAHKDIKDQKEFALAVKDRPHSSLVFSMRSGRSKSVREAFGHLTTKRAEDVIHLETVKIDLRPSQE